MDTDNVLQLENITKIFGDLVAVDNINFELKSSEIHAVLGENGAGKSTLMNLIYGLFQPTSGTISISGNPTILRSPKDAIEHGIGMVHQHFMLIENLTVAENIALTIAQFSPQDGSISNIDPQHNTNGKISHLSKIRSHLSKIRFKNDEAIQITNTLSEQFNLQVDPNALIRSLSVGLKQRVEILKALAVNARILILDEPTAVLSPQEVTSFFSVLRSLQTDNRSIIFISHKMKEVLEVSDRITVLRSGKKVYHGKTGELSARALAREMIGEEINDIERNETNETTDIVLNVSDLKVLGNRKEIAVTDLSLQTYRGEIVGIAGVDGNGQRELAEAIMGLRTPVEGEIEILGRQPKGTKNIRKCGVGYIPEDRQTTGIISAFSITDNLLLNTPQLDQIAKWGVIDQKMKYDTAIQLIDTYDIRPPIKDRVSSTLSGGNQQKIVLAREISPQPELLIAVNPTRGLDISAAQFVHINLLEQRSLKKSILLISTELDEVLQLSDRLYVMSRGKLIEATANRDDIETLGLFMTGEMDADSQST